MCMANRHGCNRRVVEVERQRIRGPDPRCGIELRDRGSGSAIAGPMVAVLRDEPLYARAARGPAGRGSARCGREGGLVMGRRPVATSTSSWQETRPARLRAPRCCAARSSLRRAGDNCPTFERAGRSSTGARLYSDRLRRGPRGQHAAPARRHRRYARVSACPETAGADGLGDSASGGEGLGLGDIDALVESYSGHDLSKCSSQTA